MSKQTAVRWLEEQLNNKWLNEYLNPISIKSLIDQALQMEQKQIEKSYTSGREQWQKYEWDNSNYENDAEIPTPRKYYNEKYGGQDE